MHLGGYVADGLSEGDKIGGGDGRSKGARCCKLRGGKGVIAKGNADGIDGTKVKGKAAQETNALGIIDVLGGCPKKGEDLDGGRNLVPLWRRIV